MLFEFFYIQNRNEIDVSSYFSHLLRGIGMLRKK